MTAAPTRLRRLRRGRAAAAGDIAVSDIMQGAPEKARRSPVATTRREESPGSGGQGAGRAGTADVVINYISNTAVRGWRRRLVSRSFVALVNMLFGLSLRYYNGTVLHRTAIIRSVTIETDSFAYQAEALVKLLRRGHSHVEVGTPIGPRVGGRTKAFRLRNAIDVARALCRLVVDVRR